MIKKVGNTFIKPIHQASCHCGAVEFELELPNGIEGLSYCNCSICRRKGSASISVPLSSIKILTGQEELNCYQFNTETARHYFCSKCGIHTHYQRRAHPDYCGFNIGCLDGVDPYDLSDIPVMDGINHPSEI